jgi:hypothetical protein
LAAERDGFFAVLPSGNASRRIVEPLRSALTLWRSASIRLTTLVRDGSFGRSIRSPFCFLRRSQQRVPSQIGNEPRGNPGRIEARDNGLVGTTLRYPYEVRSAKEYFDLIENEKVPKDMLDLAVHIVDSKTGRFEPKKFEDEYENALKDGCRLISLAEGRHGGR